MEKETRFEELVKIYKKDIIHTFWDSVVSSPWEIKSFIKSIKRDFGWSKKFSTFMFWFWLDQPEEDFYDPKAIFEKKISKECK